MAKRPVNPYAGKAPVAKPIPGTYGANVGGLNTVFKQSDPAEKWRQDASSAFTNATDSRQPVGVQQGEAKRASAAGFMYKALQPAKLDKKSAAMNALAMAKARKKGSM
jgi:hypothetical protein